MTNDTYQDALAYAAAPEKWPTAAVVGLASLVALIIFSVVGFVINVCEYCLSLTPISGGLMNIQDLARTSGRTRPDEAEP